MKLGLGLGTLAGTETAVVPIDRSLRARRGWVATPATVLVLNVGVVDVWRAPGHTFAVRLARLDQAGACISRLAVCSKHCSVIALTKKISVYMCMQMSARVPACLRTCAYEYLQRVKLGLYAHLARGLTYLVAAPGGERPKHPGRHARLLVCMSTRRRS